MIALSISNPFFPLKFSILSLNRNRFKLTEAIRAFSLRCCNMQDIFKYALSDNLFTLTHNYIPALMLFFDHFHASFVVSCYSPCMCRELNPTLTEVFRSVMGMTFILFCVGACKRMLKKVHPIIHWTGCIYEQNTLLQTSNTITTHLKFGKMFCKKPF